MSNNLVTERNMMKFFPKDLETRLVWQTFFAVNASFLDDAENVLCTATYACFSGFTVNEISSLKSKIKYVDIYFPDLLTSTIKQQDGEYNYPVLEEWISVLNKAGILRSVVSCTFMNADEVPVLMQNKFKDFKVERAVKVRFDATKTSFREIFFSGVWIREISEHPWYVYNFFKMDDLLPDKPLWEKLCTSSAIPLIDNFKGIHGHFAVNSGFFWIKKTLEEFFEELDKQGWLPFNLSLDRNIVKGQYLSLSGSYIMNTEAPEYKTSVAYEHTKLRAPRYRYSPEVYNSYLSEENFLSWTIDLNTNPKKYPTFPNNRSF